MGQIIFPKARVVKDKSHRAWRVEYDFAWVGAWPLDDGSRYKQFTRYYRTRRGAMISASLITFNHVTASQWRGTATLFDNKKEQNNG